MKIFRKLMLISLAVVWLATEGKAQISPGAFGYYADALRYSQSYQFGSARFAGLGGAGVALGGEIGSIGVNPAGLGMFNRSQFVITPSLTINQNDASFLGNTSSSEMTNLDLGNFGVVINFNKSDYIKGGWRGASLGITYNRINDFRQDIYFRGQNNTSSIIDAALEQADGFTPEELENLGGLPLQAFNHYLINPWPVADPNTDRNDEYFSFILGFPEQEEIIRRRGHTDQINISYGANYDDKVFVGAGLGFVTTEYSQSRVFTESFQGEGLSSFIIDERLDVSGTGVNVNLGVIVRPADFIRIGASYSSPTWYNFNEESDIIYASNYNDFDVSTVTDDFNNRLILEDTILSELRTETPIFISDYTIRTPSKFNAGVTFLFKKSGFLSADVEFLDYSNANISSGDFVAESDNQTINNIYGSATNIRIGGEYRYDIFRFRAGYSMLGDPFNNFDDLDRSRTIISGGLGMNFGKYFMDLAYVNTKFDESFGSYGLADGTGPTATIGNSISNVRFSFGLNF